MRLSYDYIIMFHGLGYVNRNFGTNLLVTMLSYDDSGSNRLPQLLADAIISEYSIYIEDINRFGRQALYFKTQ